MDMEPPKISQTWRNGRKGDDQVEKRLYRFLLAENMLDNPWTIKSSVTVGSISDHMPIILNILKFGFKPSSPLKFN
jgi:hypothetical protein